MTKAERRRVKFYRRCARSHRHARRGLKAVYRWQRFRRSRTFRVEARWAYYRAHPMPACTWVGESGGNYRARNPSSTAGGRYQMLDSTFHGYGGRHYPGTHDAAQAPKLEQEKIARRVLAGQGLGAWVLC